MAAKPLVLLLTFSPDYYTIDRVAEALARRGASSLRIDTDRFPTALRLSARLGSAAPEHRLWPERGAAVNLSEVHAVWLRHITKPALDPELSPEFRDDCSRESEAALRGFLDGLAGARWVDAPARVQEASIKPLQLRTARDVGLRIPRTLITNDPDEARAFFAELGDGHVVMKLLTALSFSMGPPSRVVYTNLVQASDLDDLDGLKHSPVLFQERIAVGRELRVIYAGGAVFVGAVDWRPGPETPTVDWRRAEPGTATWQAAELPGDVVAAIRSLMTRLGLAYGALDLICTPDGEHIFLEVNPTGEWGMLERRLGLPISDAIADALLDGGTDRA